VRKIEREGREGEENRKSGSTGRGRRIEKWTLDKERKKVKKKKIGRRLV